MRTRIDAIGGQLVVGSAVAQRSLIEIDRHGKISRVSMRALGLRGGMRRSRVPGKIGLISSSGIVTGTIGVDDFKAFESSRLGFSRICRATFIFAALRWIDTVSALAN